MNRAYTVEAARDAASVLALREDWEKVSLDFNVDIDFYLTVIEGGGEIVRPHAIVLKRDGVVKSILACRIEERALRVSLGYKKVTLPTMRILSVVHSGWIGENSDESATALVGAARELLKTGEADAAWFYGLETGSSFEKALTATRAGFARDLHPEVLHRWRARLPATYQELYSSRSANTRHNLKRYSKRLVNAFGDRLVVRVFRGAADIETMLSDTEAIARKGYLRGLGAGFRNDEQMRRLVCLTAKKCWLRAYILYIDGTPRSFWNGVLYRGTFFTWTTAYDPDLSDFRPGTFLLQRMLQDLCDEGVAAEVDFGFGDAQYKRDWCDEDRLHSSIFLFAPTVKAIGINAARGALMALSTSGRAVLSRAGALQGLKKAWRNHLADRVAPNGSAS